MLPGGGGDWSGERVAPCRTLEGSPKEEYTIALVGFEDIVDTSRRQLAIRRSMVAKTKTAAECEPAIESQLALTDFLKFPAGLCCAELFSR